VAAGRRGTPTSTTARGKQPPLSRHKNPEKNRSARRASALAVSRGLGLWWAGDGQVGANCLRHCGATIQTPHAQCPYWHGRIPDGPETGPCLFCVPNVTTPDYGAALSA
jgi:hypothetical protein